MKINHLIFLLTLASFAVVAGCTKSRPDQTQLDQLSKRVSELEQQVHNLEATNAELHVQMRANQPQQTADEVKRREDEFQKIFQGAQKRAREQPHQYPPPPRSQPPTNQVPHLTPL